MLLHGFHECLLVAKVPYEHSDALFAIRVHWFLFAVFHPTVESSLANQIFLPYAETADKVNDSMSLSLISRSSESDEINIARYYVDMLSLFTCATMQ